MQNFKFSKRSLGNLEGIHPHLKAVCARALIVSKVDFVVVEGLRTVERQRYLVDTGKSKTMNSAHLTGYAIDCYPIVDGDIEVSRIAPFVDLSEAFREAAQIEGIEIRWGGDWDRDQDWRDERFFDGPHYELEPHKYDWHQTHPKISLDDFDARMIDLLHLKEPEPETTSGTFRHHPRRKRR